MLRVRARGERLVFIAGQEFYESSNFPSLDFSLVYVLDEREATADMVIEKRGPKAVPAWIIPVDVKRTLTIPEHLEVLDGRLDDLGVLLRPTGT